MSPVGNWEELKNLHNYDLDEAVSGRPLAIYFPRGRILLMNAMLVFFHITIIFIIPRIAPTLEVTNTSYIAAVSIGLLIFSKLIARPSHLRAVYAFQARCQFIYIYNHRRFRAAG